MARSSNKKKLYYLITALIVLKKKNKQIRHRRYRVHPIYKNRKHHGEFFTLMRGLELYPVKFFEYFRMSQEQFYFILSKINDTIQPKFNLYRTDTISSKEKLVLTLRFLATGASFADLSFRFLMGKTTVRNCIIETIHAINKNLQELVMPAPQTPEDWENISRGFLENWNFPNCLGVVDGKHVRIFAPKNSGSFHFNYKKCFSTILMTVADANYKFIMVSIGAHGSNSDSTVFSSSNFGKSWINCLEKLKVPADAPFPGTNDPQPYVLVGDEAFGLRYNLMTPFPGHGLNVIQRIYNYRQSRARRIIESTFGILTNTWRILLKPIEVQPKLAKPLILCCCILHNFLQHSKEKNKTQNITSHSLVNHHERMKQPISNAFNIRNKFAEWLISEGNVDFQYTQ